MKEIPLTQGVVVVIDDEDYERVSRYHWCLSENRKTSYAVKHTRLPNGKKVKFSMHRLITNAPKHLEVDHKDGNGLNNTRSNLRLVTRSQNMMNKGKQSNGHSGYKGVTRHRSKWNARIQANGKTTDLGLFSTPEIAAKIYDQAAETLHGEFALTNAALGLLKDAKHT